MLKFSKSGAELNYKKVTDERFCRQLGEAEMLYSVGRGRDFATTQVLHLTCVRHQPCFRLIV